MLIHTKDLKEFLIVSRDKIKGSIIDMYFDDLFWNIQYVVVTTGGLLEEKSIIISHAALGEPDKDNKALPVFVDLDTEDDEQKSIPPKPISETKFKNATRILKWPLDKLNLQSLSSNEMKNLVTNMVMDEKQKNKQINPHLRSWEEVLGYNIQAKNGEIGHVDDFIVDSDNWKIRYLIIDTRNWLPGGKDVLISPAWIERIKWSNNLVYIDLKKEAIKNSPEYNSNEPLDDQFELRLFKYYGRQRIQNRD